MRRAEPHDGGKSLGGGAAAIACVAGLLLLPSHALSRPEPAPYRFAIAAQPLPSALAEFATVSGVDIAYRQSLAADRRSSPLQGDYTAAVALRTLLQGTGLSARFTGPRAAIVFEPGAADATMPRRGAGATPSLRLGMAEVRAPIIVGSRDRGARQRYALEAQGEIRQWLQADGAYEGRAFRLEIGIFIDPQGLIRDVRVRRPSGAPAWDDHVVRVLNGRMLSRPPPEDLSEPLAFEVVSNRPSDRAARGAPRP